MTYWDLLYCTLIVTDTVTFYGPGVLKLKIKNKTNSYV